MKNDTGVYSASRTVKRLAQSTISWCQKSCPPSLPVAIVRLTIAIPRYHIREQKQDHLWTQRPTRTHTAPPHCLLTLHKERPTGDMSIEYGRPTKIVQSSNHKQKKLPILAATRSFLFQTPSCSPLELQSFRNATTCKQNMSEPVSRPSHQAVIVKHNPAAENIYVCTVRYFPIYSSSHNCKGTHSSI